jgi:hypothetical protein
MIGNIRMPVIFGRGSLWMKYGTATATAPIQETVNVRPKYVATGWRMNRPPRSWRMRGSDGIVRLIYTGAATSGREQRYYTPLVRWACEA